MISRIQKAILHLKNAPEHLSIYDILRYRASCDPGTGTCDEQYCSIAPDILSAAAGRRTAEKRAVNAIHRGSRLACAFKAGTPDH